MIAIIVIIVKIIHKAKSEWLAEQLKEMKEENQRLRLPRPTQASPSNEHHEKYFDDEQYNTSDGLSTPGRYDYGLPGPKRRKTLPNVHYPSGSVHNYHAQHNTFLPHPYAQSEPSNNISEKDNVYSWNPEETCTFLRNIPMPEEIIEFSNGISLTGADMMANFKDKASITKCIGADLSSKLHFIILERLERTVKNLISK